jgi:hypothetical protein
VGSKVSKVTEAFNLEAEMVLERKIREAGIALAAYDGRAARDGALGGTGRPVGLTLEIEKYGREMQATLLSHYDKFSGRALADRRVLQSTIGETRDKFFAKFEGRMSGERAFGGSAETVFKTQLGKVAELLSAEAATHFHGVARVLADESRRGSVVRTLAVPVRWVVAPGRFLLSGR